MRKQRVSLLILALVALACHQSDKRDDGAARGLKEPAGARGPDPVLLRIPRDGGDVRAYLYPKLDSVVWTGQGASIGQVLGFDPEGGTLAITDAHGVARRIDLRMGEASVAGRFVKLTSLASANGADVYGIGQHGEVVRLTRSGDWVFTPPASARMVFPQTDGSLIIAGQRGADALIWRVRPPESKVLDTTVLSIGLRGARAQVGDRVYFGTDTGLVGVKTRDLSIVPSIHFADQVIAIAPTPSGDRVYVATRGGRGVSVIDRYTDKVVTEVELPGLVSELRMDPLGRYVMARPVRGDSAWVIAVATDHLVGAIQTVWTADLPACAPDGAIAVNTGRDVIFLDGETLQPVRTVVGGAKDFWYFLFWNGFRPRAAGIDQPVSFGRGEDSAARSATVDSLLSDSARVTHDSAARSPAPVAGAGAGATPVPAAASSSAPPSAGKGSPTATTLPPAGALPPAKSAKPQTFSVSFAALLNEQKAKDLATSIAVGGKKAHVVSAMRAGTMVYRVVLGPFPSHEAAQQAGQASQKPFWVYVDEQ